MMIKEEFLHYVWQHKLFVSHNLHTTNGEELQIIDVGRKNHHAGPDFFNAKIKIGNTIWAGNIEIHLQSSDFAVHKHTEDDAYQSIILHVVGQANTEVRRKTGELIPQLELTYSETLIGNYQKLTEEKEPIRCGKYLKELPDIFISSWMNTLLSERLIHKTEHIAHLQAQNTGHWEESFYIMLARNFGFGVNGDPFERLAKSLPLIYLQKHKNNLLQLEALLFGQADLLPTEESEDKYVNQLKQEYAFLRQKFNLKPLLQPEWKLARLRPVNFPHIRIAQFATLIHQSSKLFSKMIENPNYEYICSLFTLAPSPYWETHYTFKQESNKRTKQLGTKAIDILLINTIVPFLFCYGEITGNEGLKESALNLLEQIPAEANNIIEDWIFAGIKPQNAFDTQALIELKNNYCDNKACLRCRISHKVLTTHN